MSTFVIYYKNFDGSLNYAGLCLPVLDMPLYQIKFKNGFQLYFLGFRGTLEECRVYLKTCFPGILRERKSDYESD